MAEKPTNEVPETEEKQATREIPFANDDKGSTTPLPQPAPETIEDPNSILVEISSDVPIVVLFGARSSGKTMTLVRLTRFLEKNGYKVTPDKAFRQTMSKSYGQCCDQFSLSVNGKLAADATKALNFMLLHVREKESNKMYCQILEAPGEHYFDAENNMPFPPYIEEIIKGKQKKVWIFIVEINAWNSTDIRRAYAQKVANMRNRIKPADKIILLCHKADQEINTLYRRDTGMPNKEEFYKKVKEQYGEIFNSNRNVNPITRFSSPYEMDFVVFSAGSFHPNRDGTQTYNEGDESFPRNLWKVINKNIDGKWF